MVVVLVLEPDVVHPAVERGEDAEAAGFGKEGEEGGGGRTQAKEREVEGCAEWLEGEEEEEEGGGGGGGGGTRRRRRQLHRCRLIEAEAVAHVFSSFPSAATHGPRG